MTQYLSIPGNPNSPWTNDAGYLIYHSSGVLWINETPYGLTKIEKKRNLFHSIAQLPVGLFHVWDDLNTRMLLPLDSDHLLAGTLSNIFNVNIRTGKTDIARYSDNTVVKELAANHYWGCAVADKKGNIFIGTWDQWIFVYNNHLKTCRSFHGLCGGPGTGQCYRTILLDSENRIWLGGNLGLFKISANELLTNPDPHMQAVSTGDGSIWQAVFALMEDRNKNVWVGSQAGIKVFSPDGKITSYIHEERKNSLGVNEVRCIAEDKSGFLDCNLWWRLK